jgi:hypothetical protein
VTTIRSPEYLQIAQDDGGDLLLREPGQAMLPWIDAHIPPGHRLRGGLDYALVSYYEDQNGGHKLQQAESGPSRGAARDALQEPGSGSGSRQFWGG